MFEYEFTFFTEEEQEPIIESNEERTLKVRLDKWLWAARFYKTRALARAAVENQKVVYIPCALAQAADKNQQVPTKSLALDDDELGDQESFDQPRAFARAVIKNQKLSFDHEVTKPSREIEIGAVIRIRFGDFEREVTVVGLSTRRHSTEKAEELYTETAESKRLKEHASNLWHAQQNAFQQINKNEANKKTGGYLRRSTIRQKEVIDPQTNYNPNYATYDYET